MTKTKENPRIFNAFYFIKLTGSRGGGGQLYIKGGYRCAAERFGLFPGQEKSWLKKGPITRAKAMFPNNAYYKPDKFNVNKSSKMLNERS